MAHTRDKRSQLRRLYVTDRQPLEAAAAFAKVAYSTARAWKKNSRERGDDWDHARLATRMVENGPQSLVTILLEDVAPYVRSTMQELKTEKIDVTTKVECISRLADALQKITKTAGLVDPALARLSLGLEFMKGLAAFAAEHYPQHQDALLEILEPYGEHLAQAHG